MTDTHIEVESKQTSRRRFRRGYFAVVALIVGVPAAGGVYLALAEKPTPSRAVAIVNADAGVTVEGTPLRSSEKLIDKLEANEDFEWQVIGVDESAGGPYFATLTVPEDFSEAVSSLWGAAPRQARLDLEVVGSDSTAAEELSRIVSAQIGADGISDLLADMSSSRTTLQQAGMTAGFLAAGTAAADQAAQQLVEGADTLLPYLESARSGAGQLLEVADHVSEVVGAVSGTAYGLADRLGALGLTLGQVSDTVSQTRARIDNAVGGLRGTPVAPEVISALEQASSDLTPVSAQLNAVPGLLGNEVGPESDLGELVRVAMAQLSDASDQLSSGARQLNNGIVPIADQAPELLSNATSGIVDGFAKLTSLSGQLTAGLDAGVTALPARTQAQQAQLAKVLAEPVTVVRTDSAPTPILTAERLAGGFGITSIVLLGAVIWMRMRRI